MTHVGTLIKRARERRGLSLSELARQSEISKGYLHSIENGATENPSFDVVMRLAWNLGADPLTWWRMTNGERMTVDESMIHTARIYARTALEAALATLDGSEWDGGAG